MLKKLWRKLGFGKTEVKSWGYYINGPKAGDIFKSEYDLIVTDTDDQNGKPFPRETVEDMKQCPSGKKKLIIAYISLGEAEDYRWYWNKNWKKVRPVWLGKANPDWPGNYSIKQWWHPDWWEITTAILDRVINAGFDGVYIDKIDVYADLGGSDHLKDEMIDYIIKVSEYAKNKNPDFMIIAQNAEELAEDPRYLAAVDGIGKENTFYENDGTKVSKEDTGYIIENLDRFTDAGKLVLMVEYVQGSKKNMVRSKTTDKKYVLYFGPVALDRLV